MKKACIIKRTPDGKIDRVFNSIELNKSSVDRLVEKTSEKTDSLIKLNNGNVIVQNTNKSVKKEDGHVYDEVWYDINDKSRNNIGNISIADKGTYYQVSNVKLSQEKTGLGTELYTTLSKKLDKPLYSDPSLTDAAIGLWEKLVSQGVAEKYTETVNVNTDRTQKSFNRERYRTVEQSLPTQKSSYKYSNGVSTITYRKTGNNNVEIDLLDTDINERGKGNAKNLLETFLNETDSLGITTTLLISPRDLDTTIEGLEKLYKSVGFVFQRVNDIASDFEMVRPAIPVSQKIREQFSAKKKEVIPVQDKETTVLVSEFLKDKLGIDINVLNKENIAKELAKRGYSSLREMVQAWHGSAADFDRFTTEKMGTGEGAQAFGWGLYFTDLEGIAKDYARKLSDKKLIYKGEEVKGSTRAIEDIIYEIELYNQAVKNGYQFPSTEVFIKGLDNSTKNKEAIYDILEGKDIKDFKIKQDKNLYKVSLHKGKSPSEYTWLEWDRSTDKDIDDKIYSALSKTQKEEFNSIIVNDEGESYYEALTQIFGSPKQASLFLLKNGIDGIKYPAESLSAGRTSDNARGFNYVVFDENAITIDEKIQFSAGQAQSNPSYIRNTEEYGVGRDYDTDKVARERFDIPSLKQIGKGSDRTVFDLGDGKVLKVAHTARGLEQNMWEGEYMLSGIQTKVFEKGLNYVVTENVPRAKNSDVVTTYDIETGEENGTATFGQMMKDFDFFSQLAFDDSNPLLQDILRKYDMDVIRSYDVLWADFIAPRNWGYKDGVAYHIDGGTFGGIRMLDRYRGKTNLSDEDFRDVYNASKAAKKQFGDKDKYTMFEGNNDVVYGFYDQNTNQIYLTEEYLNSGTLIHENWHLWKPILNQLANKDKQAKVLLDTMERLVNESGVYNEEVLIERYNQGKTSQQSQVDFDMQAASQEANDITLNYNASGEHLAPNGMMTDKINELIEKGLLIKEC